MSLPKLSVLVLALALSGSLTAASVTPSFAKPNNGAYARSIEAQKKSQLASFCSGMRNDLALAEGKADELSGTKDAKKWSDRADAVWKDAHNAGCGWAA